MNYSKLISLLFFLIFSSVVNSRPMDKIMIDNTIVLINEITRVGETEKWNSSLFFEGPLKVHVLKDGTVTDHGVYVLSKNKFGYPAKIQVLNLNDRNNKYEFIFSPSNQPVFKKAINVDVNLLRDNNIIFKYSESVKEGSSLYSSPYSPNLLYKHVFVNQKKTFITYEFYSTMNKIEDQISYVRLVVVFNQHK